MSAGAETYGGYSIASKRGRSVLEQSVWQYIEFGTALRFLQDARENWSIKGKSNVYENLSYFLSRLDELGLVVTLNVASAEGLYGLLAELGASGEGGELTADQATRLQDAVTSVRKTLTAETLEKKAFVTAPKRWDVDRLLTDPGSLFGAGVFESLSRHAEYDFREAAKCIAFERPTAAAFHIMRGTEAVLRALYGHIARDQPLPSEQLWGPMISRLGGLDKPPPSSLLDNLDAIRKNFRNPTQHPDAIYDIDSAQDLLGLVVPAINQMIRLMDY